MKEELNGDDCKELLFLLVNQAISDYVHLFATKNRKERKALYTAEGFLFDDKYTINWGGLDHNLSDLLSLLSEEDSDPIDIGLMRDQIKLMAYEHNFVNDKLKKNSQLRLDFQGVRRKYENG
jgi:hypothetical protein